MLCSASLNTHGTKRANKTSKKRYYDAAKKKKKKTTTKIPEYILEYFFVLFHTQAKGKKDSVV